MQALALIDTPDHVCYRYRVRAFEPALSRAGWSLEPLVLARGASGRLAQFARLPRYDTVILQRKLLPVWQIRALRRKARRLVFDVDDAVLYRDSYHRRGPACPRRARRFAATVRAADVVTAGNDFLAECALRAGARPERVRVIPTCVETGRYTPSAGHDRGGGLDLVWVGSSSTLQGLESQRAIWERLARELPGVRLRVICDRFPDLGAMPVVPVRWSEPTEADELAAGDVGVSWVPDDLWSRGKCGLKVLQFMAAGLPVLANPVGVHGGMLRSGRNGWLAVTPGGWVDAARALAAEPETRRRMGQDARRTVEAHYSVSAWESAFAAAVAGAPSAPGPGPHPAASGRPRDRSRDPIGANG